MIPMSSVFEIDRLQCAYQVKDHPVLYIERLAIPAGKLTAVLGMSGSGKSTLIEALGLMNNTIRAGQVLFHSKTGTVQLEQIWRRSSAMTRLRRDCFSFIFQDDYLMPHYTCSENVLIARLIQEKLPGPCPRILEEALEAMHLHENGLRKRYPNEVAGGQRQRLSFMRAILKDFEVLFGDEPTGNLDHQNSVDLFRMIREKIAGDGSTAVIVSHNIELSVEMADRIIILTRSQDPSQGLFRLNPEHIFTREKGQWENYPEPAMLTAFIKSILWKSS